MAPVSAGLRVDVLRAQSDRRLNNVQQAPRHGRWVHRFLRCDVYSRPFPGRGRVPGGRQRHAP
jgi:hypothetical protein